MINDSILLAKEIRKRSLQMVHQANASHIGGAFSMADILAVLYTSVLKNDASNPDWEDRDRFILSKGHACVALYSVLCLRGYFPVDLLDEYGKDGSKLLSHTTHYVPGVEISAGSLGHGLPIGCGIALAAKYKKKSYRTYVLVGDGEMDEGSNWEALLLAAHQKLDNLCLIVDYNKIQSLGNTNEVLNLEPLKSKFEAFNWNVIQINGHNHCDILKAFTEAEKIKGKPTVIIADTIKGKGVSYMENELLWHYRAPNKEQLEIASKEIDQ
ncbi:transketolase [Bacteroides sp. 519]|uniref:transketolase n=1 Tax=Bacteroides sp. 519 TaxID=2302937 RepID=UPI0013D44F40|nr:transketolase [Bacteroides sp. 519]NDV58030.1 transketolase [Bacteroides sp. 519]